MKAGGDGDNTDCQYSKQVPVENGWLMQCQNERIVYLIENQKRREFRSGKSFEKMGFDFDDIKKIPVQECLDRLFWVPVGEWIT